MSDRGYVFYQVFIFVKDSLFCEGEGSRNGLALELLTYWLSWFIFLSVPEDGLNDYVFLLTILLTNGKNVALAPIYLGSLYVRLNKCVTNVTRSLRRYNVLSCADSVYFTIVSMGALSSPCTYAH